MSNTENELAYYPQDASVDELEIITSSGSFNVRRLLVELSYYEDLYSFVVSGYVILRDGQGIIEKLELSGKESISIALDRKSTRLNSSHT